MRRAFRPHPIDAGYAFGNPFPHTTKDRLPFHFHKTVERQVASARALDFRALSHLRSTRARAQIFRTTRGISRWAAQEKERKHAELLHARVIHRPWRYANISSSHGDAIFFC